MWRNFFIVKLLVLISSISSIDGQNEKCYADTDSPYVFFETNTAYYASRHPQMDIPKNCSPIYVWAVLRHGTKYPSKMFIDSMKKLIKLRDEILKNHNEGRGSLCHKDLKNLQNWTFNITIDMNQQLTSQGVKDHIFLARKFKETFPELLIPPSKYSFVFQSSKAQRTKDSAIAFSNELLHTSFANTSGNNITENHNLLYITSVCPRFSKEVRKNPATYTERKLFIDSEVVKNLRNEISIRLGFQQPLPYDSLGLMYSICGFETAWYINSRPAFCAGFSAENLKVIEYGEDLTEYYRYGYGNSFIEKIGSVVVRDMIKSLLNAAENPNTNHKAKFYFSHLETIWPLSVKLGLNHDHEPLKHDNFEKMKDRRKWKSAFFNSFAANTVAVLFRCHTPNGEQNRVVFYQNERLVIPPKCPSTPCTLEDLQLIFQDVLNETDSDLEFCKISKPLKKSSGNTIFLSSSILLFLFSVLFV